MNDNKKILVVDDEADILQTIEFTLKEEGYEVMTSMDGNLALQLYEKCKPDLILLDIMLPGMNGFEVCKAIREQDKQVLILMLTAKTGELDTVSGLELGADDYIPKPVRLKELVARVKSHLRHEQSNNEDRKQTEPESGNITIGNLSINLNSYSVNFKGEEIELTQREFDLLKKLASSPNRVFSREQLLEEVWGWSFIGESRTIDVHIRYLREKLEEDPASPKLIKTVRGIGYKIIAPAAVTN